MGYIKTKVKNILKFIQFGILIINFYMKYLVVLYYKYYFKKSCMIFQKNYRIKFYNFNALINIDVFTYI
jgi:hypothetical protein